MPRLVRLLVRLCNHNYRMLITITIALLLIVISHIGFQGLAHL